VAGGAAGAGVAGGDGAEVRREVLAGLVPMLAIADRCELERRFLAVRGDPRTYRIHLGSGSILMSPDDQYLCIVAARDGRAGKLFLPFDDDPILSLILSKGLPARRGHKDHRPVHYQADQGALTGTRALR
jgi:hypothetical protein